MSYQPLKYNLFYLLIYFLIRLHLFTYLDPRVSTFISLGRINLVPFSRHHPQSLGFK